MPDKIINEKEKNKPDKVFITRTDNYLELPIDKEIIFDGDEGKAVFDKWIKDSKDKGRDLTIKCGSGRLTFRNRGGA